MNVSSRIPGMACTACEWVRVLVATSTSSSSTSSRCTIPDAAPLRAGVTAERGAGAAAFAGAAAAFAGAAAAAGFAGTIALGLVIEAEATPPRRRCAS